MKTFNPHDWLPNKEKDENAQKATLNNKNTQKVSKENIKEQNHPKSNVSDHSQPKSIETYLKVIEATNTDLTIDYATWRDIGFAFSEEFGETGRDYFHRVSRFHPEYNSKECDEQFKKCLDAKGSGITIATFYHYFFKAGLKLPGDFKIESKIEKPDEEHEDQTEEEEAMPTFPDEIYQNLPEFLQKVVEPATSPEEKDILLLGALTTLSACFPKLYGIYDGKKVFPNLYLFVTAPASAGKGRLSLCKKLVVPIHKMMREQAKVLKQQYASDLAEYNMEKNQTKEKPGKPPERMLFIPANNSTTGVFQLLSDNKGHGLIFETEGDTLAQSFKSDYGNYSDGFRKAFHHETISYYRRTDREYVDIEYPCLSTVLSGTPKQITALIPNAENGLFSRFLFYYMNLKPEWKDVFALNSEDGIDQYYLNLGFEFLQLYRTLQKNQEIRVSFKQEHRYEFNNYFTQIQNKYLNLEEEEYIATIRRMGIITFRLSMILTGLRIMEDGDINKEKEVEDLDFQSIMEMVKVLVKHSGRVFTHLPEETRLPKRANRKERFLEALPKEFTREDYIRIAQEFNIPHRSVERYITQFVKAGFLHREAQGIYLNSAKNRIAETAESGDSA